LSFAAFALMVPWSVEAACAPADAAGTWDAYSVGADGFGLFWNRCTIKLNSSARLQSGSSCVSKSWCHKYAVRAIHRQQQLSGFRKFHPALQRGFDQM
jgi:hypothetical protein